MLTEPQDGPPTKPGWYTAKMKSWPIYEGRATVKVTGGPGTGSLLQVWQCGDERPWPIEAWDWFERVFP